MNKRKIGFIHTSPAAIAPLMQFYNQAAPDFEITNLLDDGLLRLLSVKDHATAVERLRDMISVARRTYQVELAMVTCSSVSVEMIRQLKDDSAFPVLKIDYPMAQMAVKTGNKIGVAATFQPTVEPTSNLLRTAATEAGVDLTITKEVIPEAYEALLANNVQKHDSLLLEAVRKLESSGVDVIVLAQVSMARLLPLLPDNIKVPVLSSLQTSLDAIRDSLRHQQSDKQNAASKD